MQLIIPILIALLSLAVLAFLLRSMLSPFFGSKGLSSIFGYLGSLKGASERKNFAQRQKVLDDVLKEMKDDQIDAALHQLPKAFLFEHIKLSPELLGPVGRHNLTALGEIIHISKKKMIRLENLGKIEGLLDARIHMMKNYFEISANHQELRKKRRKEGKSLPEWADGEYKGRLDDLLKDLDENYNSLADEMSVIFQRLHGEIPSSDSTIH